MSIPASVSLFVESVRKSGLVDPVTLDQYLSADPPTEQLLSQDLAGRMVRDGLLTSFQASHLLKGRFKNFLIGKFKLLQPLGSGGMSHVYLCEHVTMKHRVALKLLPAKESKDPNSVSRFLREARAAATVNHPNLVRAHDFDKSADGKYYYLIMDYVDGVNLHDLVKKIGALPPNQAANYIAQAAMGLQHILECGLIHRDLKPSNLILDRSGVIRITDLGLARFTNDSGDQLTRQISTQAVIGTADYIAPEQALNVENLDIRADIYSLGVTFYFLLVGNAPFEQQSVAQKLLSHQIREPDPIPGIPPDMQTIVSRMLKKAPADRYQAPIEILEALSPWLNESPPLPDESYFPNRATTNGGPPTVGPRSTTATANSSITRRSSPSRINFQNSSVNIPRDGSTSSILPPFGEQSKQDSAVFSTVRRRGILIGGLIALSICVILGSVYLLRPKPRNDVAAKTNPGQTSPAVIPSPDEVTTPDTRPPMPPLPQIPEGAVVVGPQGSVATVSAALQKAKSGDRILVLGPEHTEDPIRLERLPKGVTIEGWPENQTVGWKSPSADQPLLRIAATDSLTIKNLQFDGKGNTPVLIEISGVNKGLHLDHVSATGFSQTAIKIHDTVGDPTQPINLDRLRITGSADVGVLLTGESPNKHIRIDWARFEGSVKAGIRIQSPAENLQITYGRFDSLMSGILFDRDPRQQSVNIVNNTFSECRVGIEFATISEAVPTIEIKNNLFYKTKQTASCRSTEGKLLYPVDANWIWFDDKLEKNLTSIPPGDRFFRKTFEVPAGAKTQGATLDIGCATSFEVRLNGELVGKSDPGYFTKRIYAFPVEKLLKPGRNVLTVTGHHTRDPISSGFATAAGLTARLGLPEQNPWTMTDTSWKVTDSSPPAEWTNLSFDDASWPPVKLWDTAGFVFPWQGSIWDSNVQAELKLSSPVVFRVEGNVRDYLSQDQFPLLNCLRGYVPELAGTDPNNDATYLRTPRKTPTLYTIGTGKSPIGVPVGR